MCDRKDAFNTIPESARLYLRAHGVIYAEAPAIHLSDMTVVTPPIYGCESIVGSSDDFIKMDLPELRSVLCNYRAREEFSGSLKAGHPEGEYLVGIHKFTIQDMNLNFMFAWTDETESGVTYRVNPAGLVDFVNRDSLNSTRGATFDDDSEIYRLKEREFSFSNIAEFNGSYWEWIHIWLPQENPTTGDPLNANIRLATFFFERAIYDLKHPSDRKVNWGTREHTEGKFIFRDVLSCTLGELLRHVVFPSNTLLMLLTCRSVVAVYSEDYDLGTGKFRVGEGSKGGAVIAAGKAKERSAAGLGKFLKVGLADQCRVKPCEGNVGMVSVHGTYNSHWYCKQEGCTDCDTQMTTSGGDVKTCRGCEEAEAIVIKCLHTDVQYCFTVKEILGYVSRVFSDGRGFNVTDIPTPVPAPGGNCIIPGLTVAALGSISDSAMRRPSIVYVQGVANTAFGHVAASIEDSTAAAARYLYDVVYAFKFNVQLLRDSFSETVAPVLPMRGGGHDLVRQNIIGNFNTLSELIYNPSCTPAMLEHYLDLRRDILDLP